MNDIIPENLSTIAPLLDTFEQPLLAYFTHHFFDYMLGRNADHPLVQLQSLLDFAPVEEACASSHHKSGRGRSVHHTVPRLARVIFLKYHGNHSLRDLAQRLKSDMLYRWFAGYGFTDAPPDRSTIHAFESYLQQHHPRLFFDTVLRQIDATFPDQRTANQIGDTFAVEADAAREPLIPRLRHCAARLLRALKKYDLPLYEALEPKLDWVGLVGEDEETHYSRLTKAEQNARLQRTTCAIQHLLACLPEEVPEPVAEWVGWVNKVYSDELEETVDETTGEVQVQLREERGTYRVFGATDPEATIRNHGKKQDAGYNVSVAVTPDFVREISAATGSEPDPAGIPRLLEAQQTHHGVQPPKLIYDQAAGRGLYFAQVETLSGGQTQLVAKVVELSKKSDRFGPADFTLSADGLSLTCPHGRTTHHRYPVSHADGHDFRFSAGQCRGCPLLTECRGSDEYPTTRRSVFISAHQATLQRARAYAKTETFKAEMRQRSQVERVIAGLVRHNGARRARFRGRAKVDFQMKMCAMVYNAKRWLRRLHPPAIPPLLREEWV